MNIAARVCALAKPGEVLVTDTVRSLTRTGGRLTFTSVGRRILKGIAEPIALYRAEPAGSGISAAAGGRGSIWRRPIVLAGMGAVLGVGVLVAVALTSGLAGSLLASPSSSASLTESVAPAPIPYHVGLLASGSYVTDTFNTRMQFELGSGWKGLRDEPDQLSIEHEQVPGAEFQVYDVSVVFDGPCEDSPTRVLGGEPRELATYFQEHPYLTASDAVPISVAGLTGLAVEISLTGHPTTADCPGGGTDVAGPGEQYLVHLIRTVTGSLFRVGDGNKVWVIAMPVDGRLIVFFIEAPKARFPQFQVRARAILDTLTFP